MSTRIVRTTPGGPSPMDPASMFGPGGLPLGTPLAGSVPSASASAPHRPAASDPDGLLQPVMRPPGPGSAAQRPPAGPATPPGSFGGAVPPGMVGPIPGVPRRQVPSAAPPATPGASLTFVTDRADAPGPAVAPVPVGAARRASAVAAVGTVAARARRIRVPRRRAATNADRGASVPPPAASTKATAGSRRRGPAVSRWAIGAAAAMVIVAIVGGFVLMRPADGVRADPAGGVAAASLPAEGLVGPTATATPTPPPTAEPWIAAAAELTRGTYSDAWIGRMELEASLRVGDGRASTWSTTVARSGMDQWSRDRADLAGTGGTVTESVLLGRVVWTRDAGTGWVRRDRGFADQPSEPLFGIRDADAISHLRSFREDGRRLHEFRIDDASDLLALGLLRSAGVGALDRTEASVVSDDDGRPVRAELVYSGTVRGEPARLVIDVAYSDVGGTFTIASPRDGGPVVD